MRFTIGDNVGGYELIKELGEGNMGQVFLGKRTASSAEYALKIAYGKEQDPMIEALYKEASILKSLRNGKYPECYGFFREKEYACLLMEYIPGTNLETVICEAALSYEDRLKLAMDVADLLWQLHSHRPPIVYRDLKPSNIIKEPSGQLRLIDFGTAILYDDSLLVSQNETGAGTYGYAAPEQRLGRKADVRSDVYALGACISYLMSGVNPGLPPFRIDPVKKRKEIANIISRATMEDPKERYQNAGDLIIDLSKIVRQEKRIGNSKSLLGKKRAESINPYIKNRQWNILRSDKKFLGLW